jgi:Family of unknown function (DUF5871)
MASSGLSATATVLHIKHVDVSEITYGTPRSLDSGAKSIPIFYKGKPLIIQTEEMRIPFGIRDAMMSDRIATTNSTAATDGTASDASALSGTSNGKKVIEFSVEKESAPSFFERMLEMDSIIIDHAMKHSKQWFRKVHDKRDVLEALYTPMIKFHRDKETGEISTRYAPLFKANLPVKQGVLQTDIYDTSRNKVNLATCDLRGARGVAILQCSGLWIAAGKFGCSWRALQMRVTPSRSSIAGYAFIDDDDDAVATETADEPATTDPAIAMKEKVFM